MKVVLDRKCRHDNFQSRVKVDRCSADVRVWCDDCGEGFLWLGAPAERWPDRSMLSVEAKALTP
jgi:hypothetical protein